MRSWFSTGPPGRWTKSLQIDVVLYYAPILFQQAGFTSTKASFLSSGIIGIVMLVFTIPAQIWVDRWGRRKPLITGGSAMSICFIIIGALYARYGHTTHDAVTLESHSAQWAVVVLIFLFVANFSWSWAVVSTLLRVAQIDLLMWFSLGRQDLRLRDHSHSTPGKGMCGRASC